MILTMTNSAPSATPEQRRFYAQQVYDLVSKRPETGLVFQIDTPSQAIAGWVLKPWNKRSVTTGTLQFQFQDLLNGIAGTRSVAFQPPPLPGSNGLPIQFVIGTTGSFNELDEVARNFMAEALKTGQFMFLDNDLKIDKPKSTVVFDRDKAGDLGLKMSDLGGALATMLGGNYVEYFNLDGRSYKVIAQVRQNDRLTTEQLLSYQIRTSNNTMVPLATVAHLDNKAAPQALNHFQQINAATISGVAMPGVAMGDALATLKTLAKSLPAGYSTDFAGASRQLEQESGGFVTMFMFAFIIIYLSLAALFNSFLDPVIILISVPMSLAGALIFISVGIGGASINIYTQVGLVTLMGLVSKHGILMVEVANVLRAEGRNRTEAIIEAATIRLRPILMTTAAMVLGVLPLVTASGAGAVSRYNMGLVIATGLSIGTLFTLFVVPVAYSLIARRGREASN